MDPIQFAMIGTGWRSGFFMRAARENPELFTCVGMVYHSDEGKKRAGVWGVPLYSSAEDLLAETKPDYAVVALSRKSGATVAMTKKLSAQGIPVLMETPPGESLEELTDFYRECAGRMIQVAEQYQFQPEIAARLAVAHSGEIGRVYQSRLQLPNGYHSISVHRKALGVGMALPKVWGKSYEQKRLAGPGRNGDPVSAEFPTIKQMLFHLDYGDKQAFNDLEGDQCRGWIRTPHFNIRGEIGEIYDMGVTYMKDYLTPVHYELTRVEAGNGSNLEGHYLRGITGREGYLFENPFKEARLFDDEVAVATCMLKMGEYVRGGEPFYNLEEALQDRYLSLLTVESDRTGKVIQAEPQIWMP